MAKSAERVRPAKGQGKTAKKSNSRAKKSATPKQFMLDSGAAAIDTELIADMPSTPAMRPAPTRKRKATVKTATVKTNAKRTVSKAKQQKVAAITSVPIVTPKSFTPLPRKNAVVVWQKRGPMGHMLHWLRLNGRDFVHLFTNPPPREAAPVAPTAVKLRTKNELLRELAVLREENAIMRQRLGLPQMPLGRQVLSAI